MFKLKKGDIIRIDNQEYILKKRFKGRLKGGFQFRTWLASKDNGKFAVKLTDKLELAMKEIRAYIFLAKNKFPDRYYSDLVAVDYNILVRRNNKEITSKLIAILLKFYPYTLGTYLETNPNKSELKRIASKLRRRIRRLHDLNFIHGDLRNPNILIRKTNRGMGIRLTDFGQSRFGDDKAKRKEIRKLQKLLDRLK